MSHCKRHTQHSTSKATLHSIVKPTTHLCRVRTSVWEPPHHPQYQKTYLIRASQKSALSPSAPIPISILVPLYLLLVLLSILSAILINYLTTLESCNLSVK
jgi:cobalamin biosynthesis Mg chelatase CobN